MTEISGTLSRIVFRSEETGYTVAVLDTEGERISIVGKMLQCSVGASYALRGDFMVHPKYGEQFSFTECESRMPEDIEGILSFLSSGAVKGIGQKTAALIVNAFGNDTFKVLENEPERLLELPGIGKKKLEDITASFGEQRVLADIAVFFEQYDIGLTEVRRLYNVYGKDTVERVSEEPYRVVDDVFGVGFLRADLMAKKMGVDPEDPMRIKSAAVHVLKEGAASGNTFLPKDELCRRTAQLIEVAGELIEDSLIELMFEGRVRIEKLEERDVVYLMAYFRAETEVASDIVRLCQSTPKMIDTDTEVLIEQSGKRAGVDFSEKQKKAIATSLASPVSVITGGPGTGKTTVINGIMDILKEAGLKTAIAAPTGRAAKRITETTGYEASTIHRLLEYTYADDEENLRFGRNRENPLDADAVIIDEMSMVDLLLMQALLRALTDGTRLLMVGDADQLPPVGAGNVLGDLIGSEYVEQVELKEIFRQAEESLIVVNAHRINHGEYPVSNERDKDFFFVTRDTEEQMVETIKDLVSKRLPGHYTQYDPMRDIQVMTPTRKGHIGTRNLNEELQKILNPPAPTKAEKRFGGKSFREGDKVMQIKNNYDIGWKKIDDFEEGQGVFNGDMGVIDRIDSDYGKLTVIFDDTRYVTYDFTELDQLEPAYAVTVHKSQGSEFPVIVMPISWVPPMLATRNLLYTAVTRGKDLVVLVGSRKRMDAMVDNNSISERWSGLGVRLKSLLAKV